MTSIEETGKDVEEATQKALEQMGLTEDKVDVEILDEGSRGFLGIGQAPARVKVTMKEAPTPRPKRKPRAKPRAKPKPAPAPEPAAEEPVSPVPEEEVPSAPAGEPIPVATEEVIQQAAEIGQEVLQRILDGVGNDGKAVVKEALDGQVVLDVVGGDTARLIGRHGQMINSLQYLVAIITNRRLKAKARVIIDAEGYRARREEALRKQALYLAEQVKETGQEAVLEVLQSNERRVVHTTLAGDPDVYTYSEGEDPNRHLVISPKK